MNEIERDKMLDLRSKGVMPKEISRILNIPINTIKSYFKRHKNLYPKSNNCLNCGKKIYRITGKKAKKFCSDSCRNAYWNSHLDQVKRKAYYKIKCLYCEMEFTVYGNKNRKYCSRACYKKALKKI